ncbi:MAG: 30S ribosomal protein S8 [Candidatus Levybacteria bacterium RIFCSPLOWO2_01_FULL_39_10]|nr:MAG: 30S ribosomal protein S8 [Candidatus Levybacteria bacterium RIFCSPLOWO2_01_FULL_39_10]
MNHQISDFLIRIKNSAMARRHIVNMPYSNITKQVGLVLKKEGFIENIKEKKEGERRTIEVTIAYEKRRPVVTDIKIVSKPSLRVYKGTKSISDLEKRGKHIVVLTTNQGVMTGEDAKKKGIGGEVLFEVW